MDKKIDLKIAELLDKHRTASTMESLYENREEISTITIDAGTKRFIVPYQYYNLFYPLLEKMKDISFNALMDELKAQEDYDG